MMSVDGLCVCCSHKEVCGYKDSYQRMIDHLKDEFESFSTEENRSFMDFQYPKCKYHELRVANYRNRKENDR